MKGKKEDMNMENEKEGRDVGAVGIYTKSL